MFTDDVKNIEVLFSKMFKSQKKLLKAIQLFKFLVFLYSPIKKQQNPNYSKQNDALHYVTNVTFCITTQVLLSYYACLIFWNVYDCL